MLLTSYYSSSTGLVTDSILEKDSGFNSPCGQDVCYPVRFINSCSAQSKVILFSSNIPKVQGARHASNSSVMDPLVSAFYPRKILQRSPAGSSKSFTANRTQLQYEYGCSPYALSWVWSGALGCWSGCVTRFHRSCQSLKQPCVGALKSFGEKSTTVTPNSYV